jgi:hypothetical protein
VPAPPSTDPLLHHSRREAIVIGLVWLAATVYCCAYTYFFGYIREGHPLGRDDVRPILGIPSWVVWGYLVPWAICAVFTIWFAGWFVADDDLGSDHAIELETDIREGGLHE